MERIFWVLALPAQFFVWIILQWKRLWNRKFIWASLSMWIQYFPVFIHWLGWSISKGDIARIRAVNPTMGGLGGLIGARKTDIFVDGMDPKYLPKSVLLEAPHKLKDVKKMMKEGGISFPCIIKPNIGERGMGVQPLRTEKQLKRFLDAHKKQELLIQEYITADREWGVTCVRNPDTGTFDIIDAAEKIMPSVVGDGIKTLDMLIENHTDLDARQKRLIRADMDSSMLENILSNGERKVLLKVASINRGTRVKRLTQKEHDALVKICNTILKPLKDFHAGRFDFRAESLDDLIKGKCWVIELNGAGGMPSAVYDAQLGMYARYSIVRRYVQAMEKVAHKNLQDYAIPKIGLFKSVNLIRKRLAERKKL